MKVGIKGCFIQGTEVESSTVFNRFTYNFVYAAFI